MFAVHVVVEGEAVGGAVAQGGGAQGVGVEGGTQETSFVSVLPRPGRLYIHVETCNRTQLRISPVCVCVCVCVCTLFGSIVV